MVRQFARKAMQDLDWACYHDTSTPHTPQNNTLIERCGRTVKEGTIAVFYQSGLNVEWWAEAQQCFCFLHNVCDILFFGTTSYKRRFGADYQGPTIPFGAYVMYKPKNPQVLNEMHPRGAGLLRGILMGYDQQSGGLWSGDLLIADWEQLTLASNASSIKLKRIDAREVFAEARNDKYRFPCAEGVLAQPTGLQRPGVSTRQRNRRTVELDWLRLAERANRGHSPDSAPMVDGPDGPETNECGEGPSSPPLCSTELAGQTDAELKGLERHESPNTNPPEVTQKPLGPEDYWTVNEFIAIRHHVEPRKALYVPTQEDLPFPLDYLDAALHDHRPRYRR